MFKWITFLLFLIVGFSINAQSIPKDFKPQETTNQHTINKNITHQEGQAFNDLGHPLSITGGGLILTGAAFYIIGSESIAKKPITDSFLENYSPQNTMQYVGIGAFAAGAVLFTIFSTDRKVKTPKRKTKKKYDASEWEIVSD